jgi:hypothetical protein
MLVDILRLVFIAGGLVFIFMLVQACWQKRCNGTFESTPFWPVALIGGVANFLDTLGVGSFAVKTACYKQFKLIDDRLLPGTLNGQCVLPTVTQSLIFVGAVAVEPLTLISMMIAAAAGAAWGARHVASFDRQTIRLVMAVSLLVVAGLIFAGLLGLFPVGGDAMGLTGYKLGIALFGNFIFGVLMSTNALLPSFMQSLMGYSALQSGLTAMPRGVASLLAFLVVPWFMTRFSSRVLILVGLGLTLAAGWRMSGFDLSMTAGPIMAALFVQGWGSGLLFTPLGVQAFATIDPKYRTDASIVSAMMRNLGGSAIISIMQALLLRDASLAHARLAERVAGGDPVMPWALPKAMDPATLTGLQSLNAEVTRQASMISYVNIFSLMIPTILVLTPLVFLIGRDRLRAPMVAHSE